MQKVNEYLKVAAAARFLGISQTTLRKWADLGVIANRTLPGSGYRLFRQEDLDQFLVETAKSKQVKRKPK